MEKLRPTPEKYFKPLDPEVVWGHEYLMPLVAGRDMWGQLNLEGTYLPKDWENNLHNIKDIKGDSYQAFISSVAKDFGISYPVELFMDKQNILREVVVNNGNKEKPTLLLDESFRNVENGKYVFKNVTSTKDAMIFLFTCSRFLGALDPDNKYPRIEGEPRSYGPIDLVIPKILQGKENYFTYQDNQSRFHVKANNIVGKFGLDECLLDFDEKGFIWHAEVYPGENGTYFSRGRIGCEKDVFFSHNVDTSAQALGLLAVIAAQTNELVENYRMKERE